MVIQQYHLLLYSTMTVVVFPHLPTVRTLPHLAARMAGHAGATERRRESGSEAQSEHGLAPGHPPCAGDGVDTPARKMHREVPAGKSRPGRRQRRHLGAV